MVVAPEQAILQKTKKEFEEHLTLVKAKEIAVSLADGDEVKGEILWFDKALDLAIVKINAKNLVAAELQARTLWKAVMRIFLSGVLSVEADAPFHAHSDLPPSSVVVLSGCG